MNATLNQIVSLTELTERLNSLNLDPIKIKLMDKIEGEGWTREQADKADIMYRQFLFLSVKYPDNIIVPSKVVDKFWHTHILDTKKYFEDCQNLFGYFLHHFPYLGMRGQKDAEILADSFNETQGLFLTEFGQAAFSKEDTENSSVCNTSPGNCWPAKCNAKCNVKKTTDTTRPFFAEPFKPVNIFEGVFELA